MIVTLALALLAAQDRAPWRTDLEEGRAEALRGARPCILLLRVDSRAL